MIVFIDKYDEDRWYGYYYIHDGEYTTTQSITKVDPKQVPWQILLLGVWDFSQIERGWIWMETKHDVTTSIYNLISQFPYGWSVSAIKILLLQRKGRSSNNSCQEPTAPPPPHQLWSYFSCMLLLSAASLA